MDNEERAEQLIKKYGFDFVPLQEKFDELSADGNVSALSVDGIHPTVEGHHIIKEELQKVLAKYIDIF